MEYPDLIEVEGRSKRYWTQDGIPEIVMDGIAVIMGGAFLLQDSISTDSRFAGGHKTIMLLSVLASFLVANRAVNALKNKYTFPRGGYVKFTEPTRSQQTLSVLTGGLIARLLPYWSGFQ